MCPKSEAFEFWIVKKDQSSVSHKPAALILFQVTAQIMSSWNGIM